MINPLPRFEESYTAVIVSRATEKKRGLGSESPQYFLKNGGDPPSLGDRVQVFWRQS